MELEVECKLKEKMLICPICADMLMSEVFQCVNGHVLCDKCILKVGIKCPECRVPITGQKIRNRAIEAVLDEVMLPCSSRQYGCDKKMKRNELTAHNKICSFRAVNICQSWGLTDCQEKVRSVSDLFGHLHSAHGLEGTDTTPISNQTGFFIEQGYYQADYSGIQIFLRPMKMKVGRRGQFEEFLVIVKLVPDLSGQKLISFAVIYLSDRDLSLSTTLPRNPTAKIDIYLIQAQIETHICTWSGPTLQYKAAADANIIPYFSTSVDLIKSQLDLRRGNDFKLGVTVKVIYPGMSEVPSISGGQSYSSQ